MHCRVPLCVLFVVGVAVIGAGQVAFAQSTSPSPTPPPSPSEPRGIVLLDAGTAFGNTQAHLAYQGGLGFSLGSHVHLIAEVGRFDNIITKSLHNSFRDTSAQLSQAVGTALVPTSTVAATYALLGLRLSGSVSPRMGVFVDIRAGAAHIQPQFSATAAGTDFTPEVLETVAVPTAQTALYGTIGGGFSIRVTSRAKIDAGYAFGLINAARPLYTNTLYGGWAIGW